MPTGIVFAHASLPTSAKKLFLLLVFPLLLDGQASDSASLVVRTRTDQDSPVVNARIGIRFVDGSARSGETGPAGDVRFDGLAPGLYHVRIDAAGLQELTVTVDLSAGAAQRIDAILARGTTRKDSITVEAGRRPHSNKASPRLFQ